MTEIRKNINTNSAVNTVEKLDEYSRLAEENDTFKLTDDKTLDDLKKYGYSEVPQMHKNTIVLAKNHIGHEDVKEFLYNAVVFYIDHQADYIKDGISANKGILLYGASGTGKSSLAKETAEDIQKYYGDKKIVVIEIKFHDLASQKVSGASEKITKYFDELKNEKRFKLIIMDEMESLAPVRHNSGVLALERTDSLLKNIDDLPNTFIFGMSNHKEKIDIAMLREGRLGEVVEITAPTEDEKKLFIQKWLNDGRIKYDPKVNLNIFAVGYNIVGADYKYLQSKLYNQYLRNNKTPITFDQACKIHADFTNKLNARGE